MRNIRTTVAACAMCIAMGCLPMFVFGQEEAYKDSLVAAGTSAEFERIFERMALTNRAGKLNFSDKDVRDILAIVENKKFVGALLPRVYGWAGKMYGNGRMEEALTYFLQSANLYKEQGDRLLEGLCRYEIALIQHKAENLTEARDYYLTALSLGGDSLDHRIRVSCHNGLALINRGDGRFDAAAESFRRAYAIAAVNTDTAWMAILAGNIGSLHLRQGNYDSSAFYYQRNLDWIKKVDERENLMETYVHLGRIAIETGNPSLGIQLIDSAMLVVKRTNIRFNDYFNPLDYIHESYSMAYSKMGDFRKAYDHQKLLHEVSHAKQKSINSRNLRQLQMTDEFHHKQEELQWLKKVNDANLLVIRQQRLTSAAVIFILILVSIGTAILWATSRHRKKWNDRLSRNNQELERMNRVKNKLFSVISHDLRTPVVNLQGVLSVFKMGDITPSELPAILTTLNHQVEASGEALENLLHWAKAELADSKTNPGNVCVKSLVNRIATQLEENLSRKRIALTNAVREEIAAWADPTQLEIILRNLISNAIKFTNTGGVVCVEGLKEAGGRVAIQVRDNGVGIKTDDIKKLFASNARLSTPGTQMEKGTGIGLVIVQEMVLRNKGSISVESEPGAGTTFTLKLPASA